MTSYKFQVYSSVICHVLTTPRLGSFRHHISDPLHPLPLPSTPLPSGDRHSVVCIYEFVCLFLCSFVPFRFTSHMSEILWFLSFSV